MALIVAPLVAWPIGKAVEGLTSSALGTTGLTNRLISVSIVAGIILLAVAAGLHVLIGKALETRPHLKRYDKLTGLGLGVAQGTLVGMLLMWGLLALEPIASNTLGQISSTIEQSADAPSADHKNSPTDEPADLNPMARRILAVTRSIYDSVIGKLAKAVNPVQDTRWLSTCNNALTVLNDPRAREVFVTNETIANIKDRPCVIQALDTLRNDPQIKDILESSDGINGNGLRIILSSPTVLTIIDDTVLMEELSPIADDIELALRQALLAAGKGGQPTQ